MATEDMIEDVDLTAKEAEESRQETEAQERLTAFYKGMSSGTVDEIEANRQAIKASRREQQRAEAIRFRTIRDILKAEGRYFRDWCEAAGENYSSVSDAIRYLERCEKSQADRPENPDKPAANSSEQPDEPGGDNGDETQAEPDDDPDDDSDDDREDSSEKGSGKGSDSSNKGSKQRSNPKPDPYRGNRTVTRKLFFTADEAERYDANLERAIQDVRLKQGSATQVSHTAAMLHILAVYEGREPATAGGSEKEGAA